MENPLLDSDIIYKNNTEYAFLAQVSYSKDLLQILIDEMQFLLKFTSDNKTYLKCSNCELLYVLQSQENLSIQIFHQKKAKCQIGNNQDQCLQCQQFKNGGCFKKCFKCHSNQIIGLENEKQRIFCQICFSEICKICNSNSEIFQQFSDKCTQNNATNCQRYIYVITMMILSFIFLPIFIVLNFKKQKFQRQFMEFHQYIFAKYQPVIILFFYQVFLIVYLVKVVSDTNKLCD
ncbi:unnamed protein product (macronuclear) [Paramecium tetraurelia]|uniref:Transmembrane protein n=1 Tax=Paramecium tetraurelia TaxID=5888 RepID=A0DAM2_PARTE|nr:uncharacterized protein GSPATT00014996001 [Paramecium tetraurelia]CAK80089.1 unnamed protein product [Paramecium tetraurelia]|eukprot:XP_001447486.1 hypothetical protein (macronuclear) [Paramecium tetraurelia strain d4-2]